MSQPLFKIGIPILVIFPLSPSLFLHESSSWVEIRLHTEYARDWAAMTDSEFGRKYPRIAQPSRVT